MDYKSIKFSEVNEGDELPVYNRDITRTSIVAGAIASRDFTPVHHDYEVAQKAGANDIFLNILSTSGYIGKYLTDWSGPEGEMKKMVINLGMTVYPGDTVTHTGKIARKYTEGDENLVDVEYALSVAMGPHAWGMATLALPG
ncbi:MAG: MaoC/PaaZ C-terminal domain-containing protein [Dehalococcoidia bacterium]